MQVNEVMRYGIGFGDGVEGRRFRFYLIDSPQYAVGYNDGREARKAETQYEGEPMTARAEA